MSSWFIHFFLIFLFLFEGTCLFAVPAYPRKIKLCLGNGTQTVVTLKGDEYCKWALTEDAYTLLPLGNEWYYAKSDSTGRAVLSDYKLCPVEHRSDELRSFLAVQPRNMIPAYRRQDNSRSFIRRSVRSGRAPEVVGERRVLVILMSFPDVEFTKTSNEFDELFNMQGYSVDGAQGSVYDYFQETSYGQLSLRSDVLGPYMASYKMSYYGGNGYGGQDKNPYALFLEALNNATKEVNLADYDTDGDGLVDNVHIIFAGYGEEAGAHSNAIWSHEMTFNPITMQGVHLDSYSCSPELRGNMGTGISRIGPCCHEIGHALGAMDYYDTDYDTGDSFVGTGEWDIMAQGSWNNDGITPALFNPYVRAYNFGWNEVRTLVESGSYSLAAASTNKEEVFRIDTSSPEDYYLLEYRSGDGYDAYLPGNGLMIYHVHPSIKHAISGNDINVSAPQYMYPVCASSNYDIPSNTPASYGDINSDGCPFPGSSLKTCFGVQTIPSAFAWDSSAVDFKIDSISLNSEDKVKFYLAKDETFRPQEWETIWEESFEESASEGLWQSLGQSDCNSSWLREEISKGGSFNQVASWDNIVETVDGSYYMSLVNKDFFEKSMGLMESPKAINCMDGSAVLQFYCQCKKQTGGKVKLHVYAKSADTQEKTLLKTIEPTANVWTKNEIPLPESEDLFSVSFMGEIAGVGALFIDKIFVRSLLKDNVGITESDFTDETFPSISFLQGEMSQLQFSYGGEINSVKVCSLSGYYQKSLAPLFREGFYSVDVSDLPSGFYILHVVGTDGKSVGCKFVRQ